MFAPILAFVALAQLASAHYIFNQVAVGGQSSTGAVRLPPNNSPVTGINDPGMVCNTNASPAKETMQIKAGSSVSFVVDNSIYHKGTGALYLGKAPGKAADWDGSGQRWFKIADVGPKFNPFGFPLDQAHSIDGTIPSDIPDGEYLLRVEHTALHSTQPEWYISCAQVSITGGGNASPSMVSIPGHLDPKSPGLTTDIYYPTPTRWVMPGPALYAAGSKGNSGNNNNNTNDDPTNPDPEPSAAQPSSPATPPASSPAVSQPSASNSPVKTCKKKRLVPPPPAGSLLAGAARRHLRRSH